jgi:hypothetical protein
LILWEQAVAGVYTYAAFIGFGVTTHAHWTSEAFARAMIGYAIGKTVGKSFRKLLEKREEKISLFLHLIQ